MKDLKTIDQTILFTDTKDNNYHSHQEIQNNASYKPFFEIYKAYHSDGYIYVKYIMYSKVPVIKLKHQGN